MVNNPWPWPIIEIIDSEHTIHTFADGSWNCSCGNRSQSATDQRQEHVKATLEESNV